MADRGCRNFKPNVFNNNKCQNCFKLREAHSSSVTGPDASFQSVTRKQSGQKVENVSNHRSVAWKGTVYNVDRLQVHWCNESCSRSRDPMFLIVLVLYALSGLFKNPYCG